MAASSAQARHSWLACSKLVTASAFAACISRTVPAAVRLDVGGVYSYTASIWTAVGYAALSYRHTEPEGTSQRRGFEGKESLVTSVREGAMYVL